MSSTLDDIIFCFILLMPLALFIAAARKHWVDSALKKAFQRGIFAGCLAIVVIRFVYIPIEMYLGGDIRQFLATPRDWSITLIACIGIVGLVEEGFKALAAHIVCCSGKQDGLRSTYIFMGFAGCGLGFSVLENIQYYIVYGPSVVLPRVLVSSVAHLAFACICSYFAMLAFRLVKAPFKTGLLLNIGILSAAILHGIFDFLLFRFSVTTIGGLMFAFVLLLLYLIFEIWIQALKNDIPPVNYLAVCNVCRALTIERIRFCPFCGNRVIKSSFPTIIKK